MPIRSFIAIEIPDDMKEALGRLQKRLGSADVKTRWVDYRNIHLTTKFLGDVADSDIPKVCEVVKSVASRTPAFDLEVAGLGVFPPKGPPRVIWVGVRGDVETLGNVVENVERGLFEEVGIQPERRVFHPHLTLGRVKSTRNTDRLMRLMGECAPAEVGTFAAESVTLFMSELSSRGAVHTPMAEMKFEE